MKQIAFGNLAVGFQGSAMAYTERKDVPVAPVGFRNCFVAYKQTKAMTAKGETAPQSFAFQIFTAQYPNIVADRLDDFVNALLHDYQDKIAHATVDKESTIQPDDWSAIIADYFDTSRGGITAATMKEWVKDVFEPAFVLRQVFLNDTAATDGRIVKTDQQIEQLTRGYVGYLTQITQRQCTLPHAYLRTLEQTISRLQELELLACDDVASEFCSRINTMLDKPEDTLEACV